MDWISLGWDSLVEAAESTGWITYLATAEASGQPHVSPVAPGFTDGSVWFATRISSKKHRNLLENPSVGFHWPVGSGGVGELAAWGTAQSFGSSEDRSRIWESETFGYDLAQFFGSADNEDLAFVEATIHRARLLGADFRAQRYDGEQA